MYGDGEYLGFIDIADAYGNTKTGNLAYYYMGVLYLKMGEYEKAIDALESFDGNDVMLSSVAIGAIGDAYAQLGDEDKAISQYKEAAYNNENQFITPLYLMKAAQLLESTGQYSSAVDLYKEIQEDYPESQEGRQVEKYIARAESFVN